MTSLCTQVFQYRKPISHTSLYNGGFVAGAHREDFEHTACGPQQLLVVVVSHDMNETFGAPVGKDDQLLNKDLYENKFLHFTMHTSN